MTDEPEKKILAVIGTGATALSLLSGVIGSKAKDTIAALPDILGAHGQAWRCDFRKMLERYPPSQRSNDATLGMWCIEAPWAHPVWPSYLLALVHLRQIPRQPQPSIVMPGATHQFWLWAMNPDEPRQTLIRGERAELPILHPQNHCEQLRCPSDDAAITLMESTVRDICAGVLNPDTDAREQWTERFGDLMYRKRNS